jgi:hypothetical protein
MGRAGSAQRPVLRVKESKKTGVRSARPCTHPLGKNIDMIMQIRIESQFHRKELDNFLHIHCDDTAICPS